MRWPLIAVIALVGCSHMPEAKDESAGLGGGVVPKSYTVRQASKGDAPMAVAARGAATIHRVSYKPRAPEAAPVTRGHAADYRWIVGTLENKRGMWWIHYGVGEGLDRHGGSLELLDTGSMDGFAPGRVVRVEGDLVDPAPYEIRPSYRVRSMHMVGQ